MKTLFEMQGGKYEMQGDYRLPCVSLPQDTTEHIGIWGERHRRHLKADAPMEWVRKMNNIRNRAAEIVNAEVIYSLGFAP